MTSRCYRAHWFFWAAAACVAAGRSWLPAGVHCASVIWKALKSKGTEGALAEGDLDLRDRVHPGLHALPQRREDVGGVQHEEMSLHAATAASPSEACSALQWADATRETRYRDG